MWLSILILAVLALVVLSPVVVLFVAEWRRVSLS